MPPYKRKIDFHVGHTFSHRTEGKHAWTLFVETSDRYTKMIQRVEFHVFGSVRSPPIAICLVPEKVGGDKGSIYRYKMTQRTHRERYMVIRIVSHDGLTTDVKHRVSFKSENIKHVSDRVMEPAKVLSKRLTVVPITRNITFGIELELADDEGARRETIAHAIGSDARVDVAIIDSYRKAKQPIRAWKLVNYGSIRCTWDAPNYSKFELVSPILKGEAALEQCHDILKALAVSHCTNISVNKSMGFHVHVGVSGMELSQLKNICLNFVKYEDAMDSFMPPSRRTGGSASNEFCRSCKSFVTNNSGSVAGLNGVRHRGILACDTIEELGELLNPFGRYHKLNIQNLVTGRQPTIEFRQHSATSNGEKAIGWVRFCVAFVQNSAKGPTPEYHPSAFGADEQFDELFDLVIRDPVLRGFFDGRRKELAKKKLRKVSGTNRQSCCTGCANGY